MEYNNNQHKVDKISKGAIKMVNKKNIRKLMVENNITTKELAKQLNISVISMYKKLNGKSNFKLIELEKMSNYFNEEIIYFFANQK
jgi:transcriptional regulator with XRE-family HTH domain